MFNTIPGHLGAVVARKRKRKIGRGKTGREGKLGERKMCYVFATSNGQGSSVEFFCLT